MLLKTSLFVIKSQNHAPFKIFKVACMQLNIWATYNSFNNEKYCLKKKVILPSI